jgi:hypothetical protein
MSDSMIGRRSFLRTVTGGTAAIAAASLLPVGCSRQYPQAAAAGVKLEALSEKQYAVARAAAEVLVTGVGVTADSIAAGLDAELAIAGEPMLSDMRTVLSLMEHGTVLALRPRRFTALSPSGRAAVLDNWARSRFNLRRAAYQALRGFIIYFAYIDDSTRSITGFPGPWPELVQIPAYPVDFGEIT